MRWSEIGGGYLAPSGKEPKGSPPYGYSGSPIGHARGPAEIRVWRQPTTVQWNGPLPLSSIHKIQRYEVKYPTNNGSRSTAYQQRKKKTRRLAQRVILAVKMSFFKKLEKFADNLLDNKDNKQQQPQQHQQQQHYAGSGQHRGRMRNRSNNLPMKVTADKTLDRLPASPTVPSSGAIPSSAIPAAATAVSSPAAAVRWPQPSAAAAVWGLFRPASRAIRAALSTPAWQATDPCRLDPPMGLEIPALVLRRASLWSLAVGGPWL